MYSWVGAVTTLCAGVEDRTSFVVEAERTFCGATRAATLFSEVAILTRCLAARGATRNSVGAMGRTSSGVAGVVMPCEVGQEETFFGAVGAVTQHSGGAARTGFEGDEVPTGP